jgi:hypothetical protein
VIAGRNQTAAGKRKRADARAHLLEEILPALVDAELVGTITAPPLGSRRGDWTVKVEPPKDYLEATAKTGRTPRPKPRKAHK